ncbi:unnamed protein product, partial [marine sediment metagenome]
MTEASKNRLGYLPEERGLYRKLTIMDSIIYLASHKDYVELVVMVLLVLYFTSLNSYLLFHSLAEIFTVVVACGIFVLTWHSRRFLENNYLVFIGLAYLFIGSLDLAHTLAYTGMQIFPGYGTNLPA